MGWWSAKLVRIVGIAAHVDGTPPASGHAAMIAANHVSWVDIFLVHAVRPSRFIAKSEIRDWPVAGWIAERSGTLFVRRARRHDAGRIAERAHEALAQGDCIGLFPEGTTTDGDLLLAFHTSLFEPAIANRAPIHPCAIRYEHADGTRCGEVAYAGETTFMESLAGVIRQRGVHARLSFGPPIESVGIDRREAARRSHDAVATLLGLPSGTPP